MRPFRFRVATAIVFAVLMLGALGSAARADDTPKTSFPEDPWGSAIVQTSSFPEDPWPGLSLPTSSFPEDPWPGLAETCPAVREAGLSFLHWEIARCELPAWLLPVS